MKNHQEGLPLSCQNILGFHLIATLIAALKITPGRKTLNYSALEHSIFLYGLVDKDNAKNAFVWAPSLIPKQFEV